MDPHLTILETEVLPDNLFYTLANMGGFEIEPINAGILEWPVCLN